MDITKAGSRPSNPGPAEYFSGTARVTPLFEAPAPARAAGASVTFQPGATPTSAMTHIAIQEKLDGRVVDWMEQVTDEQYRA